MSKELGDLMVIITACSCLDTDFISSNECVKKFENIKNALKEKEQQDDILKTLKEAIKFSQTMPHIEPNEDNGFDIMTVVSINIQRDIENKKRELLRKWVLKTCFPKELKALEVIVNKDVNVSRLKVLRQLLNEKALKQYNKWVSLTENELTQEEYVLLKEVLL